MWLSDLALNSSRLSDQPTSPRIFFSPNSTCVPLSGAVLRLWEPPWLAWRGNGRARAFTPPRTALNPWQGVTCTVTKASYKIEPQLLSLGLCMITQSGLGSLPPLPSLPNQVSWEHSLIGHSHLNPHLRFPFREPKLRHTEGELLTDEGPDLIYNCLQHCARHRQRLLGEIFMKHYIG